MTSLHRNMRDTVGVGLMVSNNGNTGAVCAVAGAVLWLLVSSVVAQAPGGSARVHSALLALDATDLDADWYFTMDLVEQKGEGTETLVIASDPTRDPDKRRQLIAVNGDAPDAARRAQFREAEEKRIAALDPDATGYVHMVDRATLREVAGSEGFTGYSFTPRVQDLENVSEQLEGVLQLNDTTGEIDRLVIRNAAVLKPAFSVTVEDYRLVLTFEAEQGEQMIRTLQSRALGKAGFLKRFDSMVDITFRDFRRASP
ncbi:MAG: hypothetical protein HRT77_12965 [Halioglobus sp.]|nr:hypothetical protein [Halioglobus sp.]